MMTFKPDRCPDCGAAWSCVEESMLVFSYLTRNEDGEYDWSTDLFPVDQGDPEPVEDEAGRVCVHCSNLNETHMHWVEINPDDDDEDDDRKMICITWTEQHSATFSVASAPDAVYPDDVLTLREKLEGEESFQQVTEVHEWGMVDE